ncbi:uncharacterized protein [Diadema setosum]|uniref:uncharacterized protein n=1 Tax=Diadema setosum TaxID=31175 RepID=UPI003B3B332B
MNSNKKITNATLDNLTIFIQFQEIPPVKLVDGLSPTDGLLVLESNGHMCFHDFNLEAAGLVCRELGFPAVKDYSPYTISSAPTSYRTQRFLYSTGCQKARLHDCLSKGVACPRNKAVRIRCREPGFLGCYLGERHTFQALHISVFNVPSDEKCVSICGQKLENHDIAIVIEKDCGCYRSEEYANFMSSVSYTHYWTRQTEVESGQQVHCLYNLSVGFCELLGPVSDGHWDSNVTSIGSKMTLTCGEGFMLNASATLQCVGLPGWSTYFPAWNASVPSCRAVDNATNDNKIHDPEIFMTSSQIAVFTSSEMQPTEELTTLQKTVEMTSAVSGHHHINSMVGLYTLGTFLMVVLTLFVILSAAWYKHHKKRYRPSQVSNQLLQMHRVDTSNQNPSSADHDVLNTDGTDAEEEGHPYPNYPDNTFRDVMAHGEDTGHMSHIYQDAADTHTGASLPSNVEQVSPCAFSSQNNVSTTVTTSLTSVNIPNIHNNGIDGISLHQMKNINDNCVYQDVDLDGINGVTEDASRSPGGARLFDGTCYNSLNFDLKSGGVCPKRKDARVACGELEYDCVQSCKSGDFAKSRTILRDNDYDHINHVFHGDRAQVHRLARPSVCPTSQLDLHSKRQENIFCSNIRTPTAAPCEDVYYFQLDPGVPMAIDISNRPFQPEVFGSSEYSLLKSEKASIEISLADERESDNFTERLDTETPIREEMYARVNKTRGTVSSPKPAICEELYAKVDKIKKECNIDAQTTYPVEVYPWVNETKGSSLSDDPVMCEELYANVDKTRDSCTADRKPAFHEEMYMNFTDT